MSRLSTLLKIAGLMSVVVLAACGDKNSENGNNVITPGIGGPGQELGYQQVTLVEQGFNTGTQNCLYIRDAGNGWQQNYEWQGNGYPYPGQYPGQYSGQYPQNAQPAFCFSGNRIYLAKGGVGYATFRKLSRAYRFRGSHYDNGNDFGHEAEFIYPQPGEFWQFYKYDGVNEYGLVLQIVSFIPGQQVTFNYQWSDVDAQDEYYNHSYRRNKVRVNKKLPRR